MWGPWGPWVSMEYLGVFYVRPEGGPGDPWESYGPPGSLGAPGDPAFGVPEVFHGETLGIPGVAHECFAGCDLSFPRACVWGGGGAADGAYATAASSARQAATPHHAKSAAPSARCTRCIRPAPPEKTKPPQGQPVPHWKTKPPRAQPQRPRSSCHCWRYCLSADGASPALRPRPTHACNAGPSQVTSL